MKGFLGRALGRAPSPGVLGPAPDAAGGRIDGGRMNRLLAALKPAADGLVKGFMLSTLLRMTFVLAAVVVMIRMAGLSAPAVVGFASAAYLAVLAAEAWALLPGEQETPQ